MTWRWTRICAAKQSPEHTAKCSKLAREIESDSRLMKCPHISLAPGRKKSPSLNPVEPDDFIRRTRANQALRNPWSTSLILITTCPACPAADRGHPATPHSLLTALGPGWPGGVGCPHNFRIAVRLASSPRLRPQE